MTFANEHREQHAKKIILNVGPTTFGQIKTGQKTLEMRLKKDNQTKINVGDIIIFTLSSGEDQKADDTEFLEKTVCAIRTYQGLDKVLGTEELSAILPNKPNKQDFLKKAETHYKKINIYESTFEVFDFNKQ
jgi:ASC-1-like (ASCH) protein